MPRKAAARARRPKGDGGVYQRKSDGMWVATRDVGWRSGKRRRLVGYGKREATARANLQRKVDQFKALGDVDATMLVSRWLDRWVDEIAAPRTRPRTVQAYRYIVNRHLIPHLGRYRLDQLAAQHVREMLRALERPAVDRPALAPTMVVKVRSVLQIALRDAEREGLVTRNVAKLVDGPKRVTSKDRGAYTAAQAKILLRAIAADAEAARWAFALLTGVRPGEMLGLRIDRVDLDERVAVIDRQLQRIAFRHGCGGTCGRKYAGACPKRELDVAAGFLAEQLEGGLCLTLPKSRAGERVVPLPSLLVELFRAQIDRQSRRPNPHGLMWTQDDGSPVDDRENRAAWAALVASAGLPPLDLYAARHTFVTLRLAAGEDVKVIGELIGHTDPRTTRGHYQHVVGEVVRKAVDAHAAALAEPD